MNLILQYFLLSLFVTFWNQKFIKSNIFYIIININKINILRLILNKMFYINKNNFDNTLV